jgi:hypothetical protein
MNISLFEHLFFEKILPYKVTFKVSRKFLKGEKCVALLSIVFFKEFLFIAKVAIIHWKK